MMISAVKIMQHPMIFAGVRASFRNKAPQTTEVTGSKRQNSDAVLEPRY